MGSQPDHSTRRSAGIRHSARHERRIETCKGLKATVSIEIGQLHKTLALLIAVQFASNHEAEFDVSDAIAAIIVRVEQTLTALDEAEAAS
jgi:hypothetical protein